MAKTRKDVDEFDAALRELSTLQLNVEASIFNFSNKVNTSANNKFIDFTTETSMKNAVDELNKIQKSIDESIKAIEEMKNDKNNSDKNNSIINQQIIILKDHYNDVNKYVNAVSSLYLKNKHAKMNNEIRDQMNNVQLIQKSENDLSLNHTAQQYNLHSNSNAPLSTSNASEGTVPISERTLSETARVKAIIEDTFKNTKLNPQTNNLTPEQLKGMIISELRTAAFHYSNKGNKNYVKQINKTIRAINSVRPDQLKGYGSFGLIDPLADLKKFNSTHSMFERTLGSKNENKLAQSLNYINGLIHENLKDEKKDEKNQEKQEQNDFSGRKARK